MNILWILNSPIGEISRVLGLSRSQSGTWIDAAMESLMEQGSDISLTVLTTALISQELRKTTDNITYICIPAGRMLRGKRATKKQLALWEKTVKELHPDLIHIWGTEFSLGYDLRKKFPGIPMIYTMQGVMTYISKYPYLTFPKMMKTIGFFSKIRCCKYYKEQKLQRQQAKLEQQMIAAADAVISDNEWAVSPFILDENVHKFHFIRLPIKKQFQKERWTQETAKENTLFCIAGRSGLKGIHQVLEAAKQLKVEFPNLNILIPGNISSRKPSFLFEPPYLEYLREMIQSYGLEKNVRFLGQLSTGEMIAYMKEAKVFLMPSAIENESSTLREAMFLGMPVVTGYAGDIYETVSHGENGLIYRFEEHEMLAFFVKKLLKDSAYAARLGANGSASIGKLYENHNYGKSLLEVYHTVTR